MTIPESGNISGQFKDLVEGLNFIHTHSKGVENLSKETDLTETIKELVKEKGLSGVNDEDINKCKTLLKDIKIKLTHLSKEDVYKNANQIQSIQRNANEIFEKLLEKKSYHTNEADLQIATTQSKVATAAANLKSSVKQRDTSSEETSQNIPAEPSGGSAPAGGIPLPPPPAGGIPPPPPPPGKNFVAQKPVEKLFPGEQPNPLETNWRTTIDKDTEVRKKAIDFVNALAKALEPISKIINRIQELNTSMAAQRANVQAYKSTIADSQKVIDEASKTSVYFGKTGTSARAETKAFFSKDEYTRLYNEFKRAGATDKQIADELLPPGYMIDDLIKEKNSLIEKTKKSIQKEEAKLEAGLNELKKFEEQSKTEFKMTLDEQKQLFEKKNTLLTQTKTTLIRKGIAIETPEGLEMTDKPIVTTTEEPKAPKISGQSKYNENILSILNSNPALAMNQSASPPIAAQMKKSPSDFYKSITPL